MCRALRDRGEVQHDIRVSQAEARLWGSISPASHPFRKTVWKDFGFHAPRLEVVCRSSDSRFWRSDAILCQAIGQTVAHIHKGLCEHKRKTHNKIIGVYRFFLPPPPNKPWVLYL